MNDFTIILALIDFVPVVFFTIAAVILMRDLYNKMSKGAFALFSAGVIDITLAGSLKAVWKLLYSAGLCDFKALSDVFFPVQSIGFLLAGIGILAMLICRQTLRVNAVVPPVFSGTFLFVGLMVTGLGIMTTVLCILTVKLKKTRYIAIFALSFVCSLGMGYLSSRDFSEAFMHWVAEGVNVLGQGSFLLGTWCLHKNGLVDLCLHDGERP